MTDPGVVAGAVLTGGSSRRMGTDKATLVVDGAPMARRVADALRSAGATSVVVVGLAVEGEASVVDIHPGEGPLGGVLTALHACTGAAAVVVAPCDLLAPDPAAFAALVDGLATAGADILAAVPGRADPLPLALRPPAAAPLDAAFAAGERSLRAAVAALDPVVVALPVAALADADEPSDLPPGPG